jgi:hypothetical protein
MLDIRGSFFYHLQQKGGSEPEKWEGTGMYHTAKVLWLVEA